MVTLFDIKPLERLAPICSRENVSFTAYGGVVTRYCQALRRLKQPRPKDLFGLTPFTADVDLLHSGTPAMTPHLMQAIMGEVPAAECFRWQLRSREEDRIFSEARRCNNIIPARLMELSTDEAVGLNDVWGGKTDIENQAYRFVRNGFYRQSPLFRAGRDMECLSAFIYVQLLFEAELGTDSIAQQPGIPVVKAVLESTASSETVIALQESAYLRSRFSYLLKNAIAAASSQGEIDYLFQDCGLEAMFTGLARFDRGLVTRLRSAAAQEAVSILSPARIGGDIFRTPDHTDAWEGAPTAEGSAQIVLSKAPASSVVDTPSYPAGSTGTRLPPSHQVLFASPEIPLAAGKAPCVASAPGVEGGEFLHFLICVESHSLWQAAPRIFKEEDVSVILAVSSGNDTWQVFAVPAVILFKPFTKGTTFAGWRLICRINCWNIFQAVTDPSPHNPQIKAITRIFIIGTDGA